MELQYDLKSSDDSFEIEKQLRSVSSQTCQKELVDKECVVCGFIQTQWNHYQLPCLHYAHTRCMRQWIATKKALSCPWCQDSTPKTKYCEQCKQWTDHAECDEKCPHMAQFLKYNLSNNLQNNIEKIQNSDHFDDIDKSCMIELIKEYQIDNIDNLDSLYTIYQYTYNPPIRKSKKTKRIRQKTKN